MFLAQLSLEHWRNIRRADLTFPDGLTLVQGDNAQGKTNLLEGVYVLARGASFRATREEELIAFGEDAAYVRGLVVQQGTAHTLAVALRRHARRIRLRDDKVVANRAAAPGDLQVVLFRPEDLDLVKGGPAARRRFLDDDIGVLYPAYQHDLRDYRRSLLQRNAALRRGVGEPTLAAWDEALLRCGEAVTEWRRRLCMELQPLVAETYAELAPHDQRARLVYQPNLEAEADERRRHVRRLRIAEAAHKTTLWGPHRDDIALRIGDNDARIFGSQGQQRSLAVALKLAALRYAQHRMGERPVLLLDDVLSELDGARRRALCAWLANGQTILTAAGKVPEDVVAASCIYTVRKGEVARQDGH